MDIIITYDDENQLDRIKNNNYLFNFRFIDSMTRKGKKEAWKVKSHYAARLDPFAVIQDGNKPIRAFYSEAGDAIGSLIKYLDENESTSN